MTGKWCKEISLVVECGKCRKSIDRQTRLLSEANVEQNEVGQQTKAVNVPAVEALSTLMVAVGEYAVAAICSPMEPFGACAEEAEWYK